MKLKDRFRGFLPVIVDVETGGTEPSTDALLEIAVVPTFFDADGKLTFKDVYSAHIKPFAGSRLDPEALKFNKIDPDHPFRMAEAEEVVLPKMFKQIQQHVDEHHCSRAVLVGHNAWFDLLFVKAAAKRHKMKFPFHAFTSFDTATLSGMFLGQTVLAIALQKAGIEFKTQEAHSAIYDATKTAELFCHFVNEFQF